MQTFFLKSNQDIERNNLRCPDANSPTQAKENGIGVCEIEVCPKL